MKIENKILPEKKKSEEKYWLYACFTKHHHHNRKSPAKTRIWLIHLSPDKAYQLANTLKNLQDFNKFEYIKPNSTCLHLSFNSFV